MRFLGVLLLLATPLPSFGLQPRELAVIVNKAHPKSQEVADHYVKLRKVPAENVIAIEVPIGEEISRRDYEEKIVKPLRAALRNRSRQIKALLLIYGMPLRVGREDPSEAEKVELVDIEKKLAAQRHLIEMKKQVIKSTEEDPQLREYPAVKEAAAKLKQELAALEKQLHELQDVERRLRHAESEASLDSELMLLWWDDFPKARWLVNPLYWQVPEINRRFMPTVLMTARLDGPRPEIAKRLVDDAIYAEEHGLKGAAYIDARGIAYDPKSDATGTGYGGYDESMRELAELLEQKAKLPTKLDDLPQLFPPYSCVDCDLYCGWYSVAQYVPCCKFNRGAIAWHLASLEAVSLHNPQGQWCGNLLRDGVCATLGPVAEPYTIGFPKPKEFFGFLLTGEYCLVEAYSRSLILTSWMMTLIGDPLYNPYRKDRPIAVGDVTSSPKEAKFITVGPN